VAGVRPSGAEAASAVERATAARRHRSRNVPRYEGFTQAALAGRVVGVPVGREPGCGGWWLVGRVVDGIAEMELEIWSHSVVQRNGLLKRGGDGHVEATEFWRAEHGEAPGRRADR
jgi:hypothetical protein